MMMMNEGFDDLGFPNGNSFRISRSKIRTKEGQNEEDEDSKIGS